MPANTPENRLKQEVKAEQHNIPGLHLFANPRGTMKEGNRYVSYGLAPGSKDLASHDFIGWYEYTVRPSDVGKKIPIFTSIEAKAPGKTASAGQERWEALVVRAGGISAIIDDIEQLFRLFSVF